ncbi:MAG TPA: PadR family transcriptional regulator [Lachnospiraceae bacterium]|nr:PadR family transcriptional regulator [Lachnospiraceae bacterium]
MLKHGILGLINNGDKTGYEIMTVFRDSLKHFWTAQTSQIYRELQTMEKAGWIRQQSVSQAGKPDKNVFSITPAGHDELLRWLRDDNLPAGVRNPFLMKTFFMGELPVEDNIAFFRAFQEASVFPDEGKQASAKADLYQQAVKHPEKAIYWKLTIEFGRMYEKMQREWCEYCIRELEAFQCRNKNIMHSSPVAACVQEEEA